MQKVLGTLATRSNVNIYWVHVNWGFIFLCQSTGAELLRSLSLSDETPSNVAGSVERIYLAVNQYLHSSYLCLNARNPGDIQLRF